MHPLSRGYLTSLCPVHSLGRDRVGPYNTQWCERLFLQPEARIVDHRRGRVDRFCCHYLSPFIAVGPFGFYFLPRQVVAVSFAPALSPEPRQVVAQLRGAGEGTRTLDNLLGRQGLYQLSYSRRIVFILAGQAPGCAKKLARQAPHLVFYLMCLSAANSNLLSLTRLSRRVTVHPSRDLLSTARQRDSTKL